MHPSAPPPRVDPLCDNQWWGKYSSFPCFLDKVLSNLDSPYFGCFSTIPLKELIQKSAKYPQKISEQNHEVGAWWNNGHPPPQPPTPRSTYAPSMFL